MKPSIKRTLRTYYYLTKPGIIRGNLMTALAGFLLASKRQVDLGLLVATLAGIALVIASACVYNNYIDRDIDAKMKRTKKRALVRGSVTARSALLYATVLGLSGFGLLIYVTNGLTVLLGAIGFIDYIALYGYFKRQSTIGTIVGSISGAVPPTAGYTAVTNQFDGAALLLFLILVLWQMPHFFAIAMYRLDDYEAAGVPVLPAVKGLRRTKRQILRYIGAFTVTAPLLTVFGYTGNVYFAVALLLGVGWFWYGARGFQKTDDVQWARRMFFVSLLVLLTWCVPLYLSAFLI